MKQFDFFEYIQQRLLLIFYKVYIEYFDFFELYFCGSGGQYFENIQFNMEYGVSFEMFY